MKEEIELPLFDIFPHYLKSLFCAFFYHCHLPSVVFCVFFFFFFYHWIRMVQGRTFSVKILEETCPLVKKGPHGWARSTNSFSKDPDCSIEYVAWSSYDAPRHSEVWTKATKLNIFRILYTSEKIINKS